MFSTKRILNQLKQRIAKLEARVVELENFPTSDAIGFIKYEEDEETLIECTNSKGDSP